MAGLFDDSLANAEAALLHKPSLPCIVNHIESLKNAIVSRWHFAMLNDEGATLLWHHHAPLFIPTLFSSSEYCVSARVARSHFILGL
jgi:hypothetical protein